MTTDVGGRRESSPRPRPRLLALTVALGVAALLVVPAAAAALVAAPPPSPPVTELPSGGGAIVRVSAPAGWVLTDAARTPGQPTTFTGPGDAQLVLIAATGTADLARYVERQRRWGGVAHGWAALPAEPVTASDGFAGPSFTVRDDSVSGSGGRGRMAVVGRGDDAVAVWVVGSPLTDVEPVLPAVLASLRSAR